MWYQTLRFVFAAYFGRGEKGMKRNQNKSITNKFLIVALFYKKIMWNEIRNTTVQDTILESLLYDVVLHGFKAIFRLDMSELQVDASWSK